MVLFLSLVGFAVLLIAIGGAVLLGPWGWIALVIVAVSLIGLGVYDLTQKQHSILRNYPVIGHARYLLEKLRPELQQYFIERDYDGRPFNRETRSVIYQRAKRQNSQVPYGTELDLELSGTEYLLHTTSPVTPPDTPPQVRVGGPECTQPYQMSLFNISSMSFGALSPRAVLAMNKGAALGGFVQETGEGGISEFHLEYHADLFWEIGSGYFGCRHEDGSFDPERFAEKAQWNSVKGVTIKISQGAKPGYGGVLPSSKITPEIAQARGVPEDQDCISPAAHPEFATPRQLMEFVARLRKLAGGKPIGYKFCPGSRTDVLGMCKAMLATGITPDYIIVDGAEGGSGAAPLEYSDTMGMPLTEGLMMVHNALVGAGLRDHIKIGASGKIAKAGDIIKRLIQGADFTLSARGMMMATGCIQAQRCHTNKCPSGVATQNPRLYKAINVEDKGERVYYFHDATIQKVMDMIASMGVDDPAQLDPRMLRRRINQSETGSYEDLFTWLAPGQLLDDPPQIWAADWRDASADRFGFATPNMSSRDDR